MMHVEFYPGSMVERAIERAREGAVVAYTVCYDPMQFAPPKLAGMLQPGDLYLIIASADEDEFRKALVLLPEPTVVERCIVCQVYEAAFIGDDAKRIMTRMFTPLMNELGGRLEA